MGTWRPDLDEHSRHVATTAILVGVRLTQFTDYALRVLVYAATAAPERASVSEVAKSFDISHNHLVKVVHKLGQLGFLDTVRGKGGGFSLAQPAETIRIGDVVRGVEPDFRIAECFDDPRACPISGAPCRLAALLDNAQRAFLAELDRATLADVTADRQALVQLLGSAGR